MALEMLKLDHPFHAPPWSVTWRMALDEESDVLAQVAAMQPLVRSGGRLVRHESRDSKIATEMLLIAFGELVATPDSRIGFRSLQVGPVLTPHPEEVEWFPEFPLPRWLPDPSIPVTAALLRLVSPERIVSQAVAEMRASEYWRQVAVGLGAEPMSERQLRAYRRLHTSRPPGVRPSEREIELIARRYIQLVAHQGVRRPLPIMADELGLSRAQVRDRVHRARDLGYLEPARPGRVSAEPGPKMVVPDRKSSP